MNNIPTRSRKRILYIHHDSGKSGASRSLAFLLKEFDGDKFQGEINCIFSGEVTKLFEETRLEIIEQRGIYPFHGSTVSGMNTKLFIENFLKIPSTLATSFKIIRKVKPDLIHLNSSSLFVVGAMAKMINKNKSRLPRKGAAFAKKYYRIYHKTNELFFVDHFVAIDHFTADSMKYRKNQMDVVYNSVDFKSYHANLDSKLLKQELGLNDQAVLFLYLARVARCNGTIEFIENAERLLEKHSNYHFVITGLKQDSSDAYSKEVTARAEGKSNFHLMIFRDDVPLLISGSDIMVVPFTEPHFARSIIEAAAMGKPAIGSNVGGVDELILHDQTGYIYKNDDEFLAYSEKLAEDPSLREKMGRAAVDFAVRNFDNVINSKKVFDLYDTLI